MKQNLWAFKLFSALMLILSLKGWGQATLPFSYDGGKANLPTGLTQNGLGTDYSSSPKMKFDNSGDYLKLYFTGTPDKLSYKISFNAFSGGIYEVLESPDDVTYTTLRSITSGSTTATFTDNINTSTRYIKWIYTNKSTGNIGLGAITLTAAAVTTTPVVTGGTVNGTVGTPISYQINASNVPQSYAVASGTLPAGLSLNTTTGIISGTPTSSGNTSVSVTASNTAGTSAPATVNFNISEVSNACFNEDFASASAGNSMNTSGSGTAWDGNTNFPKAGNSVVYQAGGAVRIGSSSAAGYITSSTLDISGDVTVQLDVKGWTTKEGNIEVTLGGVTKTINDYTALMSSTSFETRALTFTGVPLNSTLKIATNTGRAFIDNIKIICSPSAVIWNGSSWSNTNGPDATQEATIDGDYSGASFTARNLTVNSGRTLTVNSGVTVSVASKLTNKGTITVNDGGNFIQTAAGTDTNATTGGTFTVNKNTSSAKDKYVFWSTAVKGVDMYGIYPSGTPKYVMTYNPDTDYYDVVAAPATATPGIGYSVKVPADAAPAVFSSSAPNNGDITVNLDNTANANGNTYNLIGNPYPSNFNLVSFYNGGTNGVSSSFYFWDNISATNTQQTGAGATTWAVFNASSGTWSEVGQMNFTEDQKSVKPGQGFIVSATATSTTMTNAMRTDATAAFANRSAGTGDKFWLGLTAPNGSKRSAAVTYGGNATEKYESWDSKSIAANDDIIYTLAEGEKLAIQGRPAFTAADKVALEVNALSAGIYTISLDGAQGLFKNQAVYLFDSVNGTLTDLTQRTYTFDAVVGTQNGRFSIVYGKDGGTLGTGETKTAQIEVYRNGETFTVKAPQAIAALQVYDMSGRMVKDLKPGTMVTDIALGRGAYILKVTAGDKTLTVKVAK